MQLLGRWARLARGHVPFSAACSCGIGLGGVRIADFEQQILDYLRGKFGAACVAPRLTRLEDLLRELAVPEDGLPEGVSAQLLSEINRVIDSFEEAHRAGS